MMRILSIETSCDETSVAVVEYVEAVALPNVTQTTATQIDIHRATGGVVPEVAAREHVQAIIPLVDETMRKAGIVPEQIDRIAVTSGPGLMTSLLVGVETARTLAYAWNKPLYGTNHIAGHIAANFLTHENIAFPAVALVVSGGHTELLHIDKADSGTLTYELLGATRDDAAGECFDKCARVLGLPYPGGPAISKLAAEGNREAVEFPRPMLNKPGYEFSFSGLKTAVLYYHRDNPEVNLADVCASLEAAIVEVLTKQTAKAVSALNAKSVLVGGGVAANTYLREQLTSYIDVPVYFPTPEYSTDNAAMIAAACALESDLDDATKNLWNVKADPGWEVTPR